MQATESIQYHHSAGAIETNIARRSQSQRMSSTEGGGDGSGVCNEDGGGACEMATIWAVGCCNGDGGSNGGGDGGGGNDGGNR